MQPAASWPPESTSTRTLPAATALGQGSFEVRHQGELLGAITVSMPAADPMNPSKEKLIRDLASQAGLVLRNVRLIEELRASRRRIVTTQDERAKTLERNIHDGAQQQLVALAVKPIGGKGSRRKDSDRTASMLSDLQGEANDALENLRDLARGIYPPLLADKGLPAALEAQARKSTRSGRRPSAGRGAGTRRRSSPAIYFCCARGPPEHREVRERIARVGRALAGRRSPHLPRSPKMGVGSTRRSRSYGTGLQGMADRIDSIGGSLEVSSSPGTGTTIVGRVPATVRD